MVKERLKIKRDKNLMFRLTAREYNAFEAECKRRQISKAELFRMLISSIDSHKEVVNF
jgi:hypothetical protein